MHESSTKCRQRKKLSILYLSIVFVVEIFVSVSGPVPRRHVKNNTNGHCRSNTTFGSFMFQFVVLTGSQSMQYESHALMHMYTHTDTQSREYIRT